MIQVKAIKTIMILILLPRTISPAKNKQIKEITQRTMRMIQFQSTAKTMEMMNMITPISHLLTPNKTIQGLVKMFEQFNLKNMINIIMDLQPKKHHILQPLLIILKKFKGSLHSKSNHIKAITITMKKAIIKNKKRVLKK